MRKFRGISTKFRQNFMDIEDSVPKISDFPIFHHLRRIFSQFSRLRHNFFSIFGAFGVISFFFCISGAFGANLQFFNSGTLGAGPEYHSIIGSQEHIYHGTTAPSLPHPFILTVPLVATVPLSWATAEPSYGPPATNLTPLNFLSIKWNQKREGSLRGGHETYLCFIVEPIFRILFFFYETFHAFLGYALGREFFLLRAWMAERRQKWEAVLVEVCESSRILARHPVSSSRWWKDAFWRGFQLEKVGEK